MYYVILMYYILSFEFVRVIHLSSSRENIKFHEKKRNMPESGIDSS